MIQVRDNIFETNSSSSHALVVPIDQSCHFSSIACSEGLDFLLDNVNELSNLVVWLYENGIEEIRYNGESKRVRYNIEKYKDKNNRYELRDFAFSLGYSNTYLPKKIILLIIFGPETEVTTRDDSDPVENENEFVFLSGRIS